MYTDQSAELLSEAMPSFNFAEDFYHHLLTIHSFPLPALSLTVTLKIVSLAYGGGLTAICLDYMYTEWTGCRSALISTTNAFWQPHPGRQFVSIPSLFYRKCILLMKLFVLSEISGRKCRTCTLYMHWPAGMREEWIFINMMHD